MLRCGSRRLDRQPIDFDGLGIIYVRILLPPFRRDDGVIFLQQFKRELLPLLPVRVSDAESMPTALGDNIYCLL